MSGRRGLTAVESRNLFSYTVRPDREDKNRSTDVFDPNSYTVRTLSPDLKAEKDGLYDGWLEARDIRKKWEIMESLVANALTFLLFIAVLAAFMLLFHDNTKVLAWVGVCEFLFIVLLAWLFDLAEKVFARLVHRICIKKHPETAVDEKTLDPRLSEAVTAARAELGIPHHAWELDILPYRHGVTSVGEAYEIRPRGTYDNIPVSVWREGQVLYLSDEDVVMSLPLSEITEVKRIKERVKFKSWYKSAAIDQEPYKADRVDEWPFSYTCKSRVEITLRDGSCLLIPGYEAETLRHILGNSFPF